MDVQRKDQVKTEREDRHLQAKASPQNETRQHLDLGLLASRTVKRYIFVL